MKRIFLICFVFAFAVSVLAGCQITGFKEFGTEGDVPVELTEDTQSNEGGNIPAKPDEETQPDIDENALPEPSEETEPDTGESIPVEPTEETQDDQSGNETAEPGSSSGITLEAIRKAVEDSGYNIYDQHQLVFLSGAKDGFSAEIKADGQTTVYSFVECETEDAAANNAKAIDDAGYNIAILKERFLSCYAVDKKDGSIKDILSSLMDGIPVDKTLYDGSQENQEDQEPSDQEDQTSSGQDPTAGDVMGIWISGAVSARYNSESSVFEDVSGMGLIYEFHDDGTFAQLIVFGNYMVTTGKYSASEEVVTLTDRIYFESSDSGQTWSAQEVLPDASCYYEAGTDDSGKYLMLGQEGANPPLEDKVNAMKFKAK